MGGTTTQRGWDSGIFKDPFQLQLFIKTENPGPQLCFSSILYLWGSFPSWNISWVTKRGNFVPECSDISWNVEKWDQGLWGWWERRGKPEQSSAPTRLWWVLESEFCFYCRGGTRPRERAGDSCLFSHPWTSCLGKISKTSSSRLLNDIEICTSL